LPIGFWRREHERRTCVVLTTPCRDAATIPTDKEIYRRQFQTIQKAIDALMYELYGLIEHEIGIVEGPDR
jgi:hypothetical protein